MSIRAFIPIWTFLYVLQFLLMPLIAPDYWVSNLFGNTMYLLALSYYFVITFLGYNGPSSPWRLSSAILTDVHDSPALPHPHRGLALADPRTHRRLDHQSLRPGLHIAPGPDPLDGHRH